MASRYAARSAGVLSAAALNLSNSACRYLQGLDHLQRILLEVIALVQRLAQFPRVVQALQMLFDDLLRHGRNRLGITVITATTAANPQKGTDGLDGPPARSHR